LPLHIIHRMGVGNGAPGACESYIIGFRTTPQYISIREHHFGLLRCCVVKGVRWYDRPICSTVRVSFSQRPLKFANNLSERQNMYTGPQGKCFKRHKKSCWKEAQSHSERMEKKRKTRKQRMTLWLFNPLELPVPCRETPKITPPLQPQITGAKTASNHFVLMELLQCWWNFYGPTGLKPGGFPYKHEFIAATLPIGATNIF